MSPPPTFLLPTPISSSSFLLPLPISFPSPSPPRRPRPHYGGMVSHLSPFAPLILPSLPSSPSFSGSFGEVYFSTLPCSGKRVVLKRPFNSPTARSLFRVEANINKKLSDSPGCAAWPKFLGQTSKNSQPFLVWEHEGGVTLDEYLTARPLADLAAVLGVSMGGDGVNVALFREVVTGLLKALRELHTRGVVHRDVKPANVLVVPQSSQKFQLIDFGSAYDRSRLGWWLSRGVETLDPLYAAPERRVNALWAERFDVFAVGLIGLGVLVPGLVGGEARLREFRVALENGGGDVRNVNGDLARILSEGGHNEDVGKVIRAMLKKDPGGRVGVEAGLRMLG